MKPFLFVLTILSSLAVFAEDRTFTSENFRASVDLETGATTQIVNPKDPFLMNWIDEKAQGTLGWGTVEGFEVQSVSPAGEVQASRGPLALTIRKSLDGERWTEAYEVKNEGPTDCELGPQNFGIRFPYACNFTRRENMLSLACNTHVWCCGDASWLYSAKLDGSRPFLVCWVTEGSLGDYSISYDCSQTKNGSWYRGALVLHPTPCTLKPGETLRLTFVYSFSDEKPDETLPKHEGAVRFAAEKYSVGIGEPVRGSVETAFDWENAEVSVDGKPIPFQRDAQNPKKATWEVVFDSPGVREIRLEVNGKKTLMRVNVLEPVETILQRRARFIAEHQQIMDPSSLNYGAYVIYDRVTGQQVVGAGDHNVGRERLSMGCVVAQALQQKMDPELMKSLRLHREFIEREMFDPETKMVFNEPGRNNQWKRAYNFPWMSDYFLEWYKLTKERKCLEYAAGILLNYYRIIDGVAHEAPCIEAAEIHRLLVQEQMTETADALKAAVLRHGDLVLAKGVDHYSAEISYTQGTFLLKIISLAHAYQLSGEAKYLAPIPAFLKNVEGFCGQQPDFHVNLLAVRYWDLFWFGKMRIFGDTQPQWLCALSGEMYGVLNQIDPKPEYRALSERILRNNLCVYFPDGFASCGYLVPFHVKQFIPAGVTGKFAVPTGEADGKRFDDWANDQDWALYYAVKFLLMRN